MNYLSFTHYMILSSANAGINTVLMEEEEPWFFPELWKNWGCPSASQSLLYGNGWICHTLIFLIEKWT